MGTISAQIHVKDGNGTLHDVQPKTTISNVSGLQTALDGKVNTVSGKGLSSNDYTTAEKNKLSGIAAGAQVNSITGVKGNTEATYRTGNVNITPANIGLENVGNFKAVSTVSSQGLSDTEKSNARANIGAGTSSFSGSYNDLSNKPTIPTKTSQLTNDSGYTTNTGTVTGVKVGSTSYSPSSGVVSLPAYPTTLPASDVSSWAKASSKPSYTQDEVGDGTTYKRVSATEKTTWNNKGTYSKPSGGIPKTDLASAVQTSLGKADTALQSFTETDPTVPAWAKASSKPSYTYSEVGAAPASHTHYQLSTIGDYRTLATKPDDYPNIAQFKGLKENSVIGNPSSDTYSYIVGLRGWSDNSGGNAHEFAFNDTGIFTRRGASTSWGSWAKLAMTSDIPSSLPASDVYAWAKASTKPSYTYSEVGAAPASHTHSYAGSSSAGGAATSANKLNSNAGSATQPVYFANGVPVATTYSLAKSVPSDAKFTDTTYSAATQSANGLMSSTDKTKLDGIATGANKTTVDSALSSSSTNPVQNQVVTAAINSKPPVIASGAVTSGSMNNITENTYALYSNGVTDGPVPGYWFFCRTDVHPAGDAIQFATITNDASAESYIRVKAGGAWGSWKKVTN